MALANRYLWLARINPRQVLWGGAMLALSLIAGAVVAAALMRHDLIKESEADVQRTVRLLAQHAARVVEPIDQAMLRTQSALARNGFGRKALTSQQVRELLQPLAVEGSYVARLVVADAEGRLLAASDQASVSGVAPIGDPWFTRLAQSRPEGLQVQAPRRSRISGEAVVPLAHVLRDGPDGAFAGLVLAALSVAELKSFHEDIVLDRGWQLALLRDDGVLLSSPTAEPRWRGALGAIDLTQLSGRTEVLVRWVDDGAGRRLIGLHRVGSWPLLAAVSVDEAAALEPFHQRALVMTSIAAALVAGVLLMAWLGAQLAQRARGLTQTLGVAEARWQSLVESSPDGILIAEKGRVLYANPAMLKLSRTTDPAALLGRRVDELLDGTGTEHPNHEFDGPPPEQVVRIEHWLRPMHGAPLDVETLVTGGPHDGDTSLQIVVRDISARKAVEQRLRDNEERYRLMVEGAPDCAYLLVDPGGTIEDVNPIAGGAVLGRPQDLPGRALATLFTQEATAAGEPARLLALASTEARRAEYEGWCRRTDGARFWAHLVISALADEADALRGFHVQVRDVSARKRLQDELDASRREMEGLALAAEAAREREKRRIARELHDDLGQVLTVQQLDVEMLAGEAAERAPELGERIDSLRQRIEDALAVTRRLAGDLRPLVLDDLGLVAALEWLLAQARGRASIDGRLEVHGEPARLRDELATAVFRIAQESLTNVMRHADAKRVELLLDIGSEGLILHVRDDGRGIDRRAMRRGLGLLGIEERARLLGGRAVIADAPGGGTSVEVRLPLSDRHQTVAEEGVS